MMKRSKATSKGKTDAPRTADGFNPDHYPLGDLPKYRDNELMGFAANPRPPQYQIDALTGNLERRIRKIRWALDRPDRDARIHSATGEGTVAGIAKLGVLAKDGTKANTNNQIRAGESRSKVSEDGETIAHIIGKLALSGEQEERAKELWPRFFGELDDRKLEPNEVSHPTDPKKTRIEYVNIKGRPRHLSFGTFAKQVSAFRTGKKLP